ncbi:hypothetical protein ONE63_000423 [Megalurothrips usitatus]|uniref:Uncharacterized protein n=1 Tax=Megalurothrips usitatus TaxID=439358 RepID=A0AAV7XYE3_9NEOP|nr:hypothetical protein ONE63_000423 [Megalurothrips usitatus]
MDGLVTVVAANLTASSAASPTSPSSTLPDTFSSASWLSTSSVYPDDGGGNLTSAETPLAAGKARYSLTEIIVIAILAGSLSIVTVVGNSMVMISFKIDKQLQTISNYFLFR